MHANLLTMLFNLQKTWKRKKRRNKIKKKIYPFSLDDFTSISLHFKLGDKSV